MILLFPCSINDVPEIHARCHYCLRLLLFFNQETRRGRFYNNASHVVVISCADTNFGDAERALFGWYQLLVLFLLPVIILLYCYVQVIRVLWISTLEHAELTNSDGYGRLNHRSWSVAATVELTADSTVYLYSKLLFCVPCQA